MRRARVRHAGRARTPWRWPGSRGRHAWSGTPSAGERRCARTSRRRTRASTAAPPQSASRPTGWPRASWRRGRPCWKKPHKRAPILAPTGRQARSGQHERPPSTHQTPGRRRGDPDGADRASRAGPRIRRPHHRPRRRAPPRPPSARTGGPCPPASRPRTSSAAPAPAAAARCAAARASCAAPASSPCATSAASSTRRTGASRTAARSSKEKVQQLAVLDEELRGLETELGTPRGDTVLREPGVGGTCPRCGELHASDARFCSRCGLDLTAAPPRSRKPRPSAADGRGAAPAEALPAERAAAPTRGCGAGRSAGGGARRGRARARRAEPTDRDRSPPRPPKPATAARTTKADYPRPRPPSAPHDRGRRLPRPPPSGRAPAAAPRSRPTRSGA